MNSSHSISPLKIEGLQRENSTLKRYQGLITFLIRESLVEKMTLRCTAMHTKVALIFSSGGVCVLCFIKSAMNCNNTLHDYLLQTYNVLTNKQNLSFKY